MLLGSGCSYPLCPVSAHERAAFRFAAFAQQAPSPVAGADSATEVVGHFKHQGFSTVHPRETIWSTGILNKEAPQAPHCVPLHSTPLHSARSLLRRVVKRSCGITLTTIHERATASTNWPPVCALRLLAS